MQIQPRSLLRLNGNTRRARQAAGLDEDAFKGGAPGTPLHRGRPQPPWQMGTSRLWSREGEQQDRSADI
jgi:hypothetical protein